MEKIQAIKGFKDILPEGAVLWRRMEETARGVLEAYGYLEIRAPMVEHTELFARSIGAQTDIVEKEMYTFEDTGGRSVTLRPEGTAGVVRSYIENGLFKSRPRSRLYYMGPMFRRERPQKGRLRQFHQVGAEAFGISSPLVDAEQIKMLDEYFGKLGAAGLEVVINSLGCRKCRPGYREKLIDFLSEIPESELCPDCVRRRDSNPMRVLDCKREKCKKATEKAPAIFDYLCDSCREHHETLEKYLAALEISYRTDPRLVRGLDYYTRTAFEFISSGLGAQSAVAAGGRYDALVEELGGPSTPAVGFAVGLERLMMLLPEEPAEARVEVFLALLSKDAMKLGIRLASAIRSLGYRCELDYEGKGLKGQMKLADKLNSKYVLIIGDDEMKSGRAVLQDMAGGEKEEVSISGNIESIVAELKKRLRG